MITEARGLIFMWSGQQAESHILTGQDRTLRSLRRGGKKLTFVTTFPPAPPLNFLDLAGVQPMRFDKIFVRKDVAPDVAAGQPILTKAVDALRNFNLLKSEIKVVGNTLLDMQAAMLSGVGFIAVAGDVQREKLLEAGAVPGQIIPDLKELPDFLGIVRNSVAM